MSQWLLGYSGSPLIEVDVHGGVVVDGHGGEGDIGVGETDEHAEVAHDLVLGERLVCAGDLGFGHVPAAAIVAD